MPTADIFTIDGRPLQDNRKANKEVVEALRDALKRARAGEFTGVFIVADGYDGSGYQHYGGNISFHTIGRLAEAKRNALNIVAPIVN